MERRKKAAFHAIIFTIIILISIVAIGNFLKKSYFLPSISQPYNWRWGNVTQSKTSVLVNVDICNPNFVKIHLKKESVSGFIKFDDIKIGKINLTKDFNLSKRIITPISLIITIDNSLLSECLYKHLLNHEKSKIFFSVLFSFHVGKVSFPIKYFNGSASINTSILDCLDKNLEGIFCWRSHPIIKIESAKSCLEDIEPSKINISHKIVTRSTFLPILLPPFHYEIFANNILIGKGEKFNFNWIGCWRNKTICSRTEIENKFLDEVWLSHFKNGGETELKINASIKFIELKLKKTIFSKSFSFDPLEWVRNMKFKLPEKEKKVASPSSYEIIKYLVIETMIMVAIAGCVYYIRRRKSLLSKK